MQRRLAAILSADVVGYSGLMEADEAGTLSRLKANRRDVLEPCVAEHGGRIVKLMGDGALVEFASVIAAVECAVALQEKTATREPDRAPADRLCYRIGVNLGDLIVDGNDIYGEGINVAARLQAIAPEGGIALSRQVRDQIDGKVAAQFEDLGEHTMKNIQRPVHVFALRPPAASGRAAKTESTPKIAICVLPFANMSDESEQEYFSDGISEDIITDLSKISALWVAARNTAFTFKGKHVDVPELARQLKVTHVLEGSVRKAGGRVRITAQLIDARGGHVWSERYDRDLKDIFALQDEISRAIVSTLKIKLLPQEKKALEHRKTSNAEAYEHFLMARQFDRTGSERVKPLIARLCKKAVALDPDFAAAWALLAMAEAELTQRGVAGFSFEVAEHAAERAVALNPDLAEGHVALAEVRARGPAADWERSVAPLEKALALDPNCYDAHLFAGYSYLGQRKFAEAIHHFELAMALEPEAYRPAGMAIQAHQAAGHRENEIAAARECIARCEKLLKVEPDHGGALGFVVTALVTLDEKDRAREWAKRAILFDPDNLRLMSNIACSMSRLGDADTAIELLSGVIPKVNVGWLRWMQVDTDLDPIRDDPRFKSMMAEAEAKHAATTKQ